MSFEDVLAAARRLPLSDRLTLMKAIEADLATVRAVGPGAVPGGGHYLSPPSPENGWKWEPSPDLLAEMQRLHDEPERREAS